MADPTRREILRLLSGGEMSAGELAERFDMTKPTVSHHFAALKKADLIRSRRLGQQIIYSLNTTVIQDVLTKIYDVFGVGVGGGASVSVTANGDATAASAQSAAKPPANRSGEGHPS